MAFYASGYAAGRAEGRHSGYIDGYLEGRYDGHQEADQEAADQFTAIAASIRGRAGMNPSGATFVTGGEVTVKIR